MSGDWGGEERRTCGGGEDYEAGPVVLDQFAHCQEKSAIGGRVEVRAFSMMGGRSG